MTSLASQGTLLNSWYRINVQQLHALSLKINPYLGTTQPSGQRGPLVELTLMNKNAAQDK